MCTIGEWENEEALAKARDKMIAGLDSKVRSLLEEISPELGVTDPVSGPVIMEDNNMLRIRLSMGGVKKRPIYKVVVADKRFPRDGRFIEKLGFYNPLLPKSKKERIKVDIERIKH